VSFRNFELEHSGRDGISPDQKSEFDGKFGVQVKEVGGGVTGVITF
jgi:hypothetical protein